LGKGLAQIGVGGAIRKIAYVDIHFCLTSKIRALDKRDTIEKDPSTKIPSTAEYR
jgi:hypothetical protein